jgi:hypothetical protein
LTPPPEPAFAGESRQPAIVVKNARFVTVRDNHMAHTTRYANPAVVIK